MVDVRERDEIARGDFDPAEVVVIPMSELERHHGNHPHGRDLITDRAIRELRLKATDLLMYNGHTPLANGEGGIAKWIR